MTGICACLKCTLASRVGCNHESYWTYSFAIAVSVSITFCTCRFCIYYITVLYFYLSDEEKEISFYVIHIDTVLIKLRLDFLASDNRLFVTKIKYIYFNDFCFFALITNDLFKCHFLSGHTRSLLWSQSNGKQNWHM